MRIPKFCFYFSLGFLFVFQGMLLSDRVAGAHASCTLSDSEHNNKMLGNLWEIGFLDTQRWATLSE